MSSGSSTEGEEVDEVQQQGKRERSANPGYFCALLEDEPKGQGEVREGGASAQPNTLGNLELGLDASQSLQLVRKSTTNNNKRLVGVHIAGLPDALIKVECAPDCAAETRLSAEVACITELHEEAGRLITKGVENALRLLFEHKFIAAHQAACAVQDCGRPEMAMDIAGNQFRNDAYCMCLRAAAKIGKAHTSAEVGETDKAEGHLAHAEILLGRVAEILE